MSIQVKFDINKSIYLRNPESSELGNNIIKKAIDLIYLLGFDAFTFKKLALEVNCTEASIYRYFENKHKLLLYILNWYWRYLDYLIKFKFESIATPSQKLELIIKILCSELQEYSGPMEYNIKFLNSIIISESSKVYLIKEVDSINKNDVFKPYKDLCASIAEVITSCNPSYKYANSLGVTLIETAHQQQFFIDHLPKLTNITAKTKNGFVNSFLQDLAFKAIDN